MKVFLVVKTNVEALHYWPNAITESYNKFLAHPHRHNFTITIKVQVSDLNRELEFFEVKQALDTFIHTCLLSKSNESIFPSFDTHSCEMIAREILLNFELAPIEVSVFEDNENGAIVQL